MRTLTSSVLLPGAAAPTMRFAHARAASERGDSMTFPPANLDPSIDPSADQGAHCAMPAWTGRW